jgi:hypothetical protein
VPRNHDEAPEWGDDVLVDLLTVIEQLDIGSYMEEALLEDENEEQ